MIQSYLQFALATGTYDPADRFDGNTILVQALDAPPHTHLIPNEDYNVSKVTLKEVLGFVNFM